MKNLLILVMLLASLTSQAVVIDLGWSPGQPADVASEMNRLNYRIENYNTYFYPDLTLVSAPEWDGTQPQVEGDVKSITLNLAGFEGYLVFKFGPVDRFFYLNDNVPSEWNVYSVVDYGNGFYTFISDVYDFSQGVTGNLCSVPRAGLSHYTTIYKVPDSNNSWLLGLALFIPFYVRKTSFLN